MLLLTINGSTYELEASHSLSSAQRDVLAVAANGIGFVRFALAGGGTISALVDEHTALTFVDRPHVVFSEPDDPRTLADAEECD